MITCNLKNAIRPAISSAIRLGGCGGEPVPSGAPVNTQQASFAPLPPSEGDTVEADEGQWSSDTPITYTYQWQLGGVDIVGATLKTLLILPSMAGLALRCVVTAFNAIGSSISTTTSAVVAVVNYVAKPNGSSQYWEFSSPIALAEDDELIMGFYGGAVSNSYAMFAEADSKQTYISTTPDSLAFRVRGKFGTPKLDGVVIDNSITLVPSSGRHIVSIGVNSIDTMSVIGGRIGGSLLINLPIFNFTIKRAGVIIHEIPLTNKAQGALQLATVGTINATMIGYDASVWVDESTL